MSDASEVKRWIIPLTQGFEAIVDEKWFEILSKSKWHAVKSKGKDQHVYAVREAKESEKKDYGRSVRMHRFIMSAPKGKLVDHINRNTLDNRESNLRICNWNQNAINASKRAGTSSKFKGVCYRHDTLKYEAIFKLHGQNKTIGSYDKEIQAALAYDRFVMHFYGEFAYLNFPDAATCEIVADKNQTIAELKAELADLKWHWQQATKFVMPGEMDTGESIEHYIKTLEQAIASQAKVIEKLHHDCGNHDISQADIDWCVICDRESNEATIARQARVIEKLKRCVGGYTEYFRAIKNGEVGPPRETMRSFEMVLLDSSDSLLKELAAIEQGEGT